ncbi:Fic family protein [Methylotenera sp.]|uniref:Fic/DOC family protein n=1 Tax=Methylotenera sp. TaxID=2051956 RepID=UPI002488C473|nr:Fic family protein [Methylotenera sp.]MDI1298899.1 Fic family protein [Methylotenera sp.]
MNSTRYSTDGLIETQFQAGSHGRVLKNLANIKRKREMDALEATNLFKVTMWAIQNYSAELRFTAQDINDLHQHWLGTIYAWAGQHRQVNISKGNFNFAMAAQVTRLMAEFERDVLAKYTPCNFNSRDEIIEALAVTHCELVLIHPFREGNGRTSRLLATLMALQAGLPLLDFSGITGKEKQAYFQAVQLSMSRDYEPMKNVFKKVVARSERER